METRGVIKRSAGLSLLARGHCTRERAILLQISVIRGESRNEYSPITKWHR